MKEEGERRKAAADTPVGLPSAGPGFRGKV
jgi:hypothetical protein